MAIVKAKDAAKMDAKSRNERLNELRLELMKSQAGAQKSAGKTKEMNTEATSQSIPKEEITDPAHQEQLLRSKEAENKKQEGIKHQLELLIQKIMK